jgi:hypothetical protein
MPWTAPWMRRTLLYKYAQKHVLFMQTVRNTPLFAPFIGQYKNDHFTKTGSGQT